MFNLYYLDPAAGKAMTVCLLSFSSLRDTLRTMDLSVLVPFPPAQTTHFANFLDMALGVQWIRLLSKSICDHIYLIALAHTLLLRLSNRFVDFLSLLYGQKWGSITIMHANGCIIHIVLITSLYIVHFINIIHNFIELLLYMLKHEVDSHLDIFYITFHSCGFQGLFFYLILYKKI